MYLALGEVSQAKMRALLAALLLVPGALLLGFAGEGMCGGRQVTGVPAAMTGLG